VKWILPPSDLYKINVDAAVSRSDEKGVAVAFCRDRNGIYQGAYSIVFQGINDSATLEALARREAMALAH
jgi:hypothetical protein